MHVICLSVCLSVSGRKPHPVLVFPPHLEVSRLQLYPSYQLVVPSHINDSFKMNESFKNKQSPQRIIVGWSVDFIHTEAEASLHLYTFVLSQFHLLNICLSDMQRRLYPCVVRIFFAVHPTSTLYPFYPFLPLSPYRALKQTQHKNVTINIHKFICTTYNLNYNIKTYKNRWVSLLT